MSKMKNLHNIANLQVYHSKLDIKLIEGRFNLYKLIFICAICFYLKKIEEEIEL